MVRHQACNRTVSVSTAGQQADIFVPMLCSSNSDTGSNLHILTAVRCPYVRTYVHNGGRGQLSSK